jgi:hypothetical protein
MRIINQTESIQQALRIGGLHSLVFDEPFLSCFSYFLVPLPDVFVYVYMFMFIAPILFYM